MKTKRIFKKSLAMQLISKGHEITKVEPHNRIKGHLVYSFILTDDFLGDLHSLLDR